MMPRIFKADLHIHTCLSPCADLNMGPKTIVDQALQQGLDVIGISDHNSSENVPAVVRAAQDRNLTVLPGMEVTSKEEVHILAVFDTVDKALRLQEIVYEHLHGENNTEAFGLQVVVNEDHDVLGFNNRLLAGATELSVEQVVDSICGLEGLAIAAHVDRETFGILGQLGFVPEELHLDALELSRNTSLEEARRRFPEYAGYAFVRSSDAHSAMDIGKVWTSLLLYEPSTRKSRRPCAGRAADGCCQRRPVLALLGEKNGRWDRFHMEDLSLHVLDIAENSIAAGAKHVEIRVRESRREDRLSIEIIDNGRGMSEDMLQKATDPFFTTRTTRRVGLGLSLFEQAAKRAGGEFKIASCPGAGTKVTGVFQYSHVDRQPLGDMDQTILALVV